MTTTAAPSRPARIAYRLVVLMLVLAVVFTAFTAVSVAVGVARGGDSLLYGKTLNVPAQLDPGDVHGLPRDVRFRGSQRVSLEIHDPSTKQTLLQSAADFLPLLLYVAGLWLLRGIALSMTEGAPV